MAAPSGTVWGSTVGGYGRIGIYVSLATTNTTVTPTVQIWFWSKYSVSDSGNTLYYTSAASSSSATDSKGSVPISTTVDSGSGWSTSNQVKIYEYTHAAITRGTSAATRYLYTKLTNIDRVGGTMYASTTFSVPKLASYTVSYNANGGSGAPSSQTKWYGKSLTLSSTKPTRTGYSFQGWATSASGGVAYAAGASYTANAGATLYAVWKANTYTVSYNANGGSGAPSSQTKTYGVTLTLSSTKPTRTNYNFLGWATSASGGVKYAAGASYTANAAVTLYAVWEVAYTKPRITSVSVARCDASGTISDDGTYALIKFNWATDQTVSTIYVGYLSETSSAYQERVAASGTSGSVNKILGTLSTELTYTIDITVTDGGGSNTVKRTINSQTFIMDALPENKGVAFGKTAEANYEGYADFGYKAKFRDQADFGNDKSIMGIAPNGTAYSALIPVTASGNTSLGHGLYKAGSGNTHIYGHRVQFYTNDGIFFNGNYAYFNSEYGIYGYSTGGDPKFVFQPQNANNNTVVGYGNYSAADGNTNIYGHDLNFGVSNIASPGTYRPYRRRGDTLTLEFRTAGYVTNSGTEVAFLIPFSVPIVGSPTVTVSCTLTLRQGNAYTHGTSASTAVAPNSVSVARYMFNGIGVVAKFSNTTNVTNNDAIGVYFYGTITLS